MVDDRDFSELFSEDVKIPIEVERKTQQAYAMIRSGNCRPKRCKKRFDIKAAMAITAAACLVLTTALSVGLAMNSEIPWFSSIVELFSGANKAANPQEPYGGTYLDNENAIPVYQTFSNEDIDFTVQEVFYDGYGLSVTSVIKVKKEEYRGLASIFPKQSAPNYRDPNPVWSQEVGYNGVFLAAYSDVPYTPLDESTYSRTMVYDLAPLWQNASFPVVNGQPAAAALGEIPDDFEITINTFDFVGYNQVGEETMQAPVGVEIFGECSLTVPVQKDTSKNVQYTMKPFFENEEKRDYFGSQISSIITTPSATWVTILVSKEFGVGEITIDTTKGELEEPYQYTPLGERTQQSNTTDYDQYIYCFGPLEEEETLVSSNLLIRGMEKNGVQVYKAERFDQPSGMTDYQQPSS